MPALLPTPPSTGLQLQLQSTPSPPLPPLPHFLCRKLELPLRVSCGTSCPVRQMLNPGTRQSPLHTQIPCPLSSPSSPLVVLRSYVRSLQPGQTRRWTEHEVCAKDENSEKLSHLEHVLPSQFSHIHATTGPPVVRVLCSARPEVEDHQPCIPAARFQPAAQKSHGALVAGRNCSITMACLVCHVTSSCTAGSTTAAARSPWQMGK